MQVHSFASQGYAYSNDNNYLTLKIRNGSPAFTDFGFNASTQVSEKLRVGAQVFDRNVGQLGNWHPETDGHSRTIDSRTGSVSGAARLYNDSQDMEFLHTWALIPQSVYPVDVRGDNITHVGGDVYGADLRWATPVKGLVVGASYMRAKIATTGAYSKPTTIPYRNVLEYTVGNLKLAGEYRREPKSTYFNAPTGARILGEENSRSGYVSAAYRVSKWLELGTYHSRFIANWSLYHGDPANHVFDQAVTARLDLNRYLDFKVEGHFIDGAMINSALDRGFYAAANPVGLKPTMNMVVPRLGFHI